MTKKEIKLALISGGMDKDIVNSLTIKELRNLHNEHLKGEESSDVVIIPEDEEEDSVVKEDCVDNNTDIRPTHPNWTQHVLGKLSPDELANGNPKIDGLRRVSEELIGTIVEECCDLIFAPSHDNNMTVGAKATIVFDTIDGTKKFEALADATAHNLTPEYKIYLTAMADTRAKARAFRNALKIKTVTAEEVGDGSTSFNSEFGSSTNIQQAQIVGIKISLDRLKITKLATALDTMDIKYEQKDSVPVIESISYDDAIKIMKYLNSMKISEVPESWR